MAESVSNPSSDLGDARSLGLHERPKAQRDHPGAPQTPGPETGVPTSGEPDEIIFARLRQDVTVAATKLWVAARSAPYVQWWASDLRAHAGVDGSVAMIALCKLVDHGLFELDSRLRVSIPYEHRYGTKELPLELRPLPEHPGGNHD